MAMEEKVVDGIVIPTSVKPGGDEEATHSATTPDVKVWDDLEEALEEFNEAIPGYEKAQAYYEGTVKEKFLNKAVQQLLTGSETDFKVNLAGRVVDAVQDRMEIAAVTAEPLDSDDTDDIAEDEEVNNETESASGVGQSMETAEAEEMSEEEKELDEAVSKIWRDNEMDIEAPEVHQKMLTYGDAYLFVGENEDEPGRVDLFFNSPLNVRILYQEENPRKKRLAIKRWEVGPKEKRRIRLNLYYPDDGGTYKFISKGSNDRAGAADFQPFVDDTTDEMGWVDNDTEEIPFFHFRTARPYGKPEHLKAYGAQDALTKIITNMMSTSDFAAFPQRWALQQTGTTTDDDLDWDSDGDEGDAKEPGSLQSQLISGPGRVWPLRNMKAVGQFQSADVEQFLKPLNTFTGLMAAVTATPVSYFLVTIGATNTAISGESQRKGESPFISKVNARQLSAEASWQDAVGYGLRLIGKTAEVKVRWAPSQVVSGKEGWEGVQAQQKAGVPVRQSLLEAGYTEAEVSSWGYTEDNPDGPGIDLSGAINPPPIPGQPMPANLGAPVSEVAPVPPTTEPVTPGAVPAGQEA